MLAYSKELPYLDVSIKVTSVRLFYYFCKGLHGAT